MDHNIEFDWLKYTDYRVLLKELFKAYKAKQKPYSYSHFSETLGLGFCNAAYLIITNRRPLTIKTARKIAAKLKISGKQRSYFIKLVSYQNEKDLDKKQKLYSQLVDLKSNGNQWTKKQLEFFGQWYHSAIYELLQLMEKGMDATQIGNSLNPKLTLKKTEESLNLLNELQLIEADPEELTYKARKGLLTTGSEIQGLIFKSYHQQMIELAQNSLSKQRASERDITSVTIGIPHDALQEYKDLATEFRRKLLELSSKSENNNQIVQVNIQMFPLTKKMTEDK